MTSSVQPLACLGAFLLEPQTYDGALSSMDPISWQTKMDQEYRSLVDNHTWNLVPKPTHKKLIRCKWIHKIKYKPNSDIDKYKACLVAKRFTQTPSINFTKTYFPAICYNSIIAIL